MISVRQIHPLFAAEVTGVDLAALTPDRGRGTSGRKQPPRGAGLSRPDASTTTTCSVSAACSATSSRRAIIASSSG